MFGTEFVTEFVIGSIGAVVAHVGVDIVVESAVKDVVLTNAQKVCVWTAKTVTETMVAKKTYKTLVGREFTDDVKEMITGLLKKNDSTETKPSSSEEEVAVA